MSSPSNPNQDNVIPLSQAHVQRKGDEPVWITASKAEEIFNKVINKKSTKNFEDLQQDEVHYYIYTTGEIANALCITLDKVVKLGKKLGLRNNSDYHIAIKIGRVAHVQKYSQRAFDKIKEAIEADKLDKK